MHQVIGIALCFAGALASARFEDVDPVVRAKAHRALKDSHDLPPIPRGLTEPPPLPPPELHKHDIGRRRGAGRAVAKGGNAKKKPAARGKAQTAGKGGARPKGGAQAAKKPAAGPAKKS